MCSYQTKNMMAKIYFCITTSIERMRSSTSFQTKVLVSWVGELSEWSQSSYDTDNVMSRRSILYQQISGLSRVYFYPLSTSVNHASMHFCVGSAATRLSEPKKNFLPSVTLQGNTTYNCSDITLSPDTLDMDITEVEYYCPDGYVFDNENYRCLKGTLIFMHLDWEDFVNG